MALNKAKAAKRASILRSPLALSVRLKAFDARTIGTVPPTSACQPDGQDQVKPGGKSRQIPYAVADRSTKVYGIFS